MKIQDNKGQYKVTIPKDIVKLKGWKQGSHVIIVVDKEGNVLIKEILETTTGTDFTGTKDTSEQHED